MGFLEKQYPAIYHEEGNVGDSYYNEAKSYLYRIIVEYNGLEHASELEYYEWPRQIYDLPTQNWVDALLASLLRAMLLNDIQALLI